MVCMTYPHIGNYGVNELDMESVKPWCGGFIVRELTPRPSNFRSQGSLEDFLAKHGIPGIRGIDTRGLTRLLRDKGAQRGMILQGRVDRPKAVKKVRESPAYIGTDWVARVTTRKPYKWSQGLESGIPGAMAPELNLVGIGGKGEGRRAKGDNKKRRYKVIAIDCGIKRNILRNLVSAGCEVTVVPAQAAPREILGHNPDGIFISNGPGDPEALPYLTRTVSELIGRRPMFGICLGHQMLGLASGGRTFKLKFGHRGGNQPVMDLATRKVEITSHNHGFAVDPKSLKGKDAPRLSHINLNDKTCEGLTCLEKKWFSVQYHPEAGPGPHDANYLFQRFIDLMKKS
jgi:carbamoyl-phosphate synthase small subunit